jgi:hypothetical protein
VLPSRRGLRDRCGSQPRQLPRAGRPPGPGSQQPAQPGGESPYQRSARAVDGARDGATGKASERECHEAGRRGQPNPKESSAHPYRTTRKAAGWNWLGVLGGIYRLCAWSGSAACESERRGSLHVRLNWNLNQDNRTKRQSHERCPPPDLATAAGCSWKDWPAVPWGRWGQRSPSQGQAGGSTASVAPRPRHAIVMARPAVFTRLPTGLLRAGGGR